MRRAFIAAAAISLSLSAWGQGKISLAGLAEIDNLRSGQTAGPASADAESAAIVSAIVDMAPGWSESALARLGVEVTARISADMIVADIPLDNIEAFAALDEVRYVEFGNKLEANMDHARAASGVDRAHFGIDCGGTVRRFDGTGVVVGLMDQGIDPNHPNFLGADGKTRVKQVYDLNNRLYATTPVGVANFTTDAAGATHGTHVAGIMAGSYNGTGYYCTTTTPEGGYTHIVEGKMPFYGVAPAADIVMCSGTFTDANVAYAITKVMEYGERMGCPAVVNLSMGITSGPHDGTSALERSFAALGERGIICISSGNDGTRDIHVGKKFTEGDTVLGTFVTDNRMTGIDIWGSSDKFPAVTLNLYDTKTGEMTEVGRIDATNMTVYPESKFNSFFNNDIVMRSETNANNNRAHIYIAGNSSPKTSLRDIAIVVTGAPGESVDLYGIGKGCFTDHGREGYTSGSADGSINAIACGDNVIVVGSYNTRTAWQTFKWEQFYLEEGGFALGEVSPFSAYGTTFDGRDLPHLCAPGAMIESSLSRYYTAAYSGDDLKEMVSGKVAAADGSADPDAYWGPQQGTSMSSPYAAGVAALVLQADPTLRHAELLEILKKSASLPAGATPGKAWGAGQIQARDAILTALHISEAGIGDVVADRRPDLFITPEGNRRFRIDLPGAASVAASLYNMQGAEVAATRSSESTFTLDASAAAPGVHILRVDAPNMEPVTTKIIVR